MKYSAVLLVFLATIAVAQAQPIVAQDFLADLLASLAAITAVILTPILEVVQMIQEAVITPIQNQATTFGLEVAVEQFCALALSQIFPADAAFLQNKCVKAAKEEIRKGFDKSWKEE
jgi:hypothetical protein